MTPLQQLQELKDYGGEARTVGLDDAMISRFLVGGTELAEAIEAAHGAHNQLREDWGEALRRSEDDLMAWLQEDYVNFYSPQTINPYVALAARGPWIVTTHGAVLHDNGGYGMLGQGHAPAEVIEAMTQPWVMANVMTPSFSHRRFSELLKAEVGQRRGHCPFARFVCMNSGSESVTVAARISDLNAWNQVKPGGPRAGQTVKFLALTGAFHGRTDRPAQASHSSLPTYRQHLASFHDRDNLVVVPPNDIDALRAAFERAECDDVFFEMMFIEPVMGEGNPGMGVSRAFYDAARELTRAHGAMLLVDSIQAGIRGTGFLSIVDYPGFEDCEVPDLETWSKALNAGQYPLSVLGMSQRAADAYVRGVYGNTMTTNPRALEVGCAVLESLTPELRVNIRRRGQQMVAGLRGLQDEFPGVVTHVQGTGLLLSAELNPERVEVVGFDGIETWCRRHGLGVIHGGKNALRFTPHFGITEAEVELVIEVVLQGLRAFVELDGLAQPARERVGAIEL